MSVRKQVKKANQNLHKQIWKLPNATIKRLKKWFLRSLLVTGRRVRLSKSGFVLPTTVLLLLVVGLVVTSLIFRSFSRTSQVIGERQQQVIYNAATPAIERAKAKLENLFTKDQHYPSGGIPPEDFLADMMHDALYNLPDETRLDLNGAASPTSTQVDNAWVYTDTASGNTIAYSILMDTQGQLSSGTNISIKDSDQNKAAAMVVRNGPVSTLQASSACQIQNNQGGFAVEQGWFKDNSSSSFLRKNFQINAVVLNNNTLNKPAATLELQQDRKVDRGNKWGAWFRNDLEIFPGPAFNWNGALHTEGSLFLAAAASPGDSGFFRAYLISSPASCLYGKDGIEASEISINQEVENGQTAFQGQIVSGAMKLNNGAPNYGFVNDAKASIDRTPSSNTALVKATDSVKDSGTNPSQLQPADIALDPLLIFTEDKSRSRNANDSSNANIRDTQNWDDSNLLAHGDTARIFNKDVPTPYLDDTYRADDRYGPKAPKGGLPAGTKVGTPITSTAPNYSDFVSNTAPAGNSEKLGLDGYWERRARASGLRLIVGQRLELGNASGWGGSSDPLYPPDTAITHEKRQRRTLRDNVAAVQASAVYYYENASGNFPVACLATTVHPGTATTLQQSTDFRERNFFTGKGTNGWEYAPPAANETDFASAIASNQPLGKALRNLAYFAGDPDGAFPPKQETSGSTVHPYPYLTMWGDFSNLRRVINQLNGGTSYNALSIADKSYLHTAACTLGMLANNINTVNNDASNSLPSKGVSLGEHIWQEFTNLSGYCTAAGNCTIPPIDLLLAGLKDQQLRRLGSYVNTYQQIKQDREYGFMSSSTSSNPFEFKHGSKTYKFNFSPRCNPNDPSYEFASLFNGKGGGLDPKKAGMSMLCEVKTKYPSLYYLFPTANHSHAGTALTNQPDTEPYVINNYIKDNAINGKYTYNVIDDANPDNFAAIAIAPKALTKDWVLPTAITPTTKPNAIIAPDSSTLYVPFLDKALFNGREMMNVRVLDVDLDMLRRNQSGSGDTWLPKSGIIYAFREDAVREDAIARPAIGTWSNYKTTWNSNRASGPPLNATGTTTWRMDVRQPNSPKDPPVNDTTGISPKPIDYYPDPDRRPYGFRLKNGSNIKRTSAGADNTYGFSFISDNSVYIQGDFNLHQNSSGALLEEFQSSQHLQDNWDNFYTRTNLDSQFARLDQDSWRPTEIVGDTVTILSNNFCDGSIEDGIVTGGSPPASSVDRDRYGCGAGSGYTSYLNQNRPTTPLANLQRENPANSNSPIKISRNGAPVTNNSGDYSGPYQNFSDIKPTNSTKPSSTRVNAIIVSGIVPSRALEPYGGFHNFPQFLEDWGGVKLYISGSFIQLNFSIYATGPYDQDDWEPHQTGNLSSEVHLYYGPPLRRWGYDVGLQYQPAGAVARRFTVPSSMRSEFYKELAVDDPYVLKLRCATKEGGGGKVDPKASCS